MPACLAGWLLTLCCNRWWYRGREAWPTACQVVVESLRTACHHRQLLRSAVQAITALITNNASNLSVLKVRRSHTSLTWLRSTSRALTD